MRFGSRSDKVRADDYILFIILFSLVVIFFIIDKIAITALLIYPMLAIITHGIKRINRGIRKKDLSPSLLVLNVLWGIFAIFLSVFMVSLVIFRPIVWSSGIVVLLAYPLIITGFAGIIKGTLIEAYTSQYRNINVYLGIITTIISFAAITFSEFWTLGFLITLTSLLILNIIFRSALYLSEFGLSLKRLENLKVLYLIIDGYYLEYIKSDAESDDSKELFSLK